MSKKKSEKKGFSSESFLSKFFNLRERNVSLALEIVAGLTAGLIVLFTFSLTSNSLANSFGGDQTQYLGILLTIGLIISGVFTIIGGFYTKLPLIFSSSLGFTSLITVSLISVLSLGWNVALGVILIEGAILMIIAFTPLGEWLFNEMPSFFNLAAPIALGCILIFFSFIAGKFVSFRGDINVVSFTLRNFETFIFIIGSVITFILYRANVRGSLLFGFAITTLLSMILPKVAGINLTQAIFIIIGLFIGWLLLYAFLVDAKKVYSIEKSLSILIIAMVIILIFFRNPDATIVPPSKLIGEGGIFSLPTFKNISLVLSQPVLALGQTFSKFGTLFVPIISLLITHIIIIFALLKTVWLYLEEDDFTDKEKNVHNKRVLLTEGGSSFVSGSLGYNSISSSFGTIASLVSGGKTGLTAIFGGITILLSLFITPLLGKVFVPFTVAPAIFVMGLSVIIKSFSAAIDYKKEDFMSLLITGVVSAFTLNILQGITAGLLSYVIEKLILCKNKDINIFTWILLFILLFVSFYKINLPFLSLS